MARKQLQIAGTEPATNQEIEDKAAIYRGHMLSRMELAKLEAQAKQDLIACVHGQIESGKLKLPDSAADGEIVTVYRFVGEDEEELEVKYGRKQNVRVRKAKGLDEADELME